MQCGCQASDLYGFVQWKAKAFVAVTHLAKARSQLIRGGITGFSIGKEQESFKWTFLFIFYAYLVRRLSKIVYADLSIGGPICNVMVCKVIHVKNIKEFG